MNLLTTAQVADRLGVTGTTVRNLVRSEKLTAFGKLPSSTGSYLFDESEVERYLAAKDAA